MDKEQELRALIHDIAEKKNEQTAIAKQLIALSRRVKELDKEVSGKESIAEKCRADIADMEKRLVEQTNKGLQDLETEKEVLAENVSAFSVKEIDLNEKISGFAKKSDAVEKNLKKGLALKEAAENLDKVVGEKEEALARKDAKLKGERAAFLEEKKENKETLKKISEKARIAESAENRINDAVVNQKDREESFDIREKALAVQEQDAEAQIAEARKIRKHNEEAAHEAIELKFSADARIEEAKEEEKKVSQAQLAVDANLKGIKDEEKAIELAKLRLKKIVRDNRLDAEILKGV